MLYVTIYCDGSAKGNPGPAGIGIVVLDRHNNVLTTVSEPIGYATSSIAEYRAVHRALEIALEMGVGYARVLTDSQIVVNQLNGASRVHSCDLAIIYKRVIALFSRLPSGGRFEWISRDRNSMADQLADEAMRLCPRIEVEA